MFRPLVTVLLDTYNHERFIEEAIVSVLEQDFPQAEMEIIVVDDGSTDRTPEIVRKFAPRVRHLRKKNGGQASAFNAGIPEAKGEVVTFLDGDDWWEKNKLSRVMRVLDQYPEVGFVGHGNISVYLDGRAFHETLREGHRFRANTVEGALLFRVRKTFLGTSRMTIRTGILRKIGNVPEVLRVQADEYLFTLAAVLCEVEVLPDALTYYRLHDSNLFMVDRLDPERMNRKYAMLDFLAKRLQAELQSRGIEMRVCKIITEIIQAEADQVRLMIGKGQPWETARTEWKMYRVISAHAPFSHRFLKLLSLAPALILPPRAYYDWRGRIAQNHWYQRLREKHLPNPSLRHVEAVWSSKA